MSDALHTGDCLDILRTMPDGCAHLIYLDPPFNTHIRRVGRARGRPNGDGLAYDDAFGSPDGYIAYMRRRVEAMRRVLAPHGSLFFHCDWRMSHHVRLMLDEVFGDQEPGIRGRGSGARDQGTGIRGRGVFVNEIIWRYGLGASRSRRRLLTKHDVIFWYANGPKYTFNLIREAPTPAMLAKYAHTDEDGRRYMMSYGRRYYLKGGKPLDDVWDIPAIAPTSHERVGYPTQKPLALLRRIIALASNEGDMVLDPFCGSGTTLVAAQALGRRWIGIDANPQAIALARARLGIGAS
ncbi:MAG: hypothetical protein KatS3mg053_2236 [Candidatus Roseilinea sp.]|nr:MAG: hypothetical protein KatS3mg053_2236 [Candidatus Roseilinea sp.]